MSVGEVSKLEVKKGSTVGIEFASAMSMLLGVKVIQRLLMWRKTF